MRKRIVLLILSTIFLIFSTLNASIGPINKGSFQVNFIPGTLKIYENYLIIGNYDNLMVYDISNPASPKEVKEYIDLEAHGPITIKNNLMVTIIHYDGPDVFYIIDAHDFKNLKMLYKWDKNDYDTIYQAAIYKNYLIMTIEDSNYKDKVVIFDISNPSNPVLKNEVSFYHLGGVYVDDNYLYIVGEKEDNGDNAFTPYLYIYDASTLPNLGNIISSVKLDICCANEIKKVDHYIFTIDNYDLGVVDISDINKPKYLGKVSGSYIGGCYFYNNYLFTLDQWGAGVEVLKIISNGDPVLLSTFEPLSGYIIDGKDNYLYIVNSKDEKGNIYIYDISSPVFPYWKDTIVAKKLIPGNYVYNGQYSGNGYVLIHMTTSFTGEDYIEVVNSTTHEVTDYFDKDSQYDINLLGRIGDINFIQKDNAILFEKVDENGKLQLVSSIDFNDENPSLANIWEENNYLYIGLSKKIMVYDISDIKNPKVVKIIDNATKSFPKGIYYNNYLYLIDGYETGLSSLKIYNLKNSSTVWSNFDSDSEMVRDIGIYNSYLFVTIYDSDNKSLDLYIYSLDNPEKPVLVKKIENFAGCDDNDAKLQIFNNYLIAWSYNHIWVFDISNPNEPVLKGKIFIPSIKYLDIDSIDKFLYVASYNAGGIVKIDFNSLLNYFNGNTSNTNGISINVKSGWNLLGIPLKTEYIPQQNGKWKTIWVWDNINNKWLVKGGNDTINNLLENYGIKSFDSISWPKGFWILAQEPFSIEFNSDEGYEISDIINDLLNGWNLIGCGSTWIISKFPDYVKMVWKFNSENGKWEIGTNNDSIKALLEKYGITQIQELHQGDGVWIYVENK